MACTLPKVKVEESPERQRSRAACQVGDGRRPLAPPPAAAGPGVKCGSEPGQVERGGAGAGKHGVRTTDGIFTRALSYIHGRLPELDHRPLLT